MTLYTNFFGIDIGKFSFVVSLHGAKSITEFDNSPAGITKFIEKNAERLQGSLCIVETTGGYELELVYALLNKGYKVHRADTRKVKNFIRSFGSSAKTDALDAKALAKYGFERHAQLDLFKTQSAKSLELFQLVQRRNDLKANIIAEKNRLKAPGGDLVKDSIVLVLEVLNNQLDIITNKIQIIIDNSAELKEKQKTLMSIPGIGSIVSFELMILMPELGKLCRRKIASLAGVAPRANDSGKFTGYRRTGKGRVGIKPVLFIAAMAARNSKTNLKEFYENLIAKGKKKMVALTALMRKILVLANAKLKPLN